MIANISEYEKRLPGEAHIRQMLERRFLLAEAERTELTQEEFANSKGLHRSTIWRHKAKAAGGELSDGRHQNPGRPSLLDPRILGWSLAYLEAFPKAKIKQVCEEVAAVAQREHWGSVNYWMLLRAINKLPADMRMAITGGAREMFEKTCLTVRRISGFPYQLVQMDSTDVPVWCLDTVTGELFRPWMTTIIDTFSRVILALQLHRREPNARDILVTLKQAIFPKDREDWPFYGLFAEIQADNHPIFTSIDVEDAMLRLGPIYSHSPNASPNANGKQERFFLRFKQQFAANLISFAGKSHALGKANKAAIPWPLMPKLAEKYLLKYHTSEHRGIHTTPWEKLHENLDIAHGLVFDAHDVLEALKIRRSFKLKRDGITLENGKDYSSPNLVGMKGQMIEVRIDPEGNDRTIEAYHNGRFVDHLRAFGDDPALGADIAKARLERTIELKKFRKQMRKLLAHAPPIPTNAVDPSTFTPAPPAANSALSLPPEPSGPIPRLGREED